MPTITIEPITATSPATTIEAARTLLLEYGNFVLAAEGPARFCFGKLQDEADSLPTGFIAMRGELLLASVDGAPAGCVTYRVIPSIPDSCEMKRLWVRFEFRGMSLGDRLVIALIERTRNAGFKAVYLDTVPASMGPAYRMYLRLGFEECAPYHTAMMDGLMFMRLSLNAAPGLREPVSNARS